jgi:hypothetical protein
MNAMNAMNVTTLNAHRSFGKLMEISLSHDAAGEHREAFALLAEAVDRMNAEAELCSSADGAALFLNLALVAGRMGNPELGMKLLERSRELFARVLGPDRVVGPQV